MIVSFNARENNEKDKMVIDWYRGLYRSERSRKIVDILYAHITDNEHTMKLTVGKSLTSKMDLYGGGFF